MVLPKPLTDGTVDRGIADALRTGLRPSTPPSSTGLLRLVLATQARSAKRELLELAQLALRHLHYI